MSAPTARRLRTLATVPVAALVLAACSDDSPTGSNGPDAASPDFRRLVVTDNTTPTARIYNAADLSLAGEMSTGAAPVSYLYTIGSGRVAVFHQRTANFVGFIDGGVFAQGNTGVRQAPAMIGTGFRDSLPTHGNFNANMAAVFFDGTGRVGFWNETDLLAGRTAPFLSINTGGAHHGAAIPKGSGTMVLTSPRNPAGGVPTAIYAHDLTGRIIDSVTSCPGLHGLAGNERASLYGCQVGGMVVEQNAQGRPVFTAVQLENAPTFGVGTVWGAPGKRYLLVRATVRGQPTSAATRTMGVYDTEGRWMRRITLPNGDIDVTGELDATGNFSIILGRSGTLYVVNNATQAIVAQLDNLVPAVPATGALTHTVATAPGVAYVTSPTQGTVLEVTLGASGSATRGRTIQVGGTPVRLTVVGVGARSSR
ncbi:MAG: hypothetical protein MUF21_10665 [Gemmatimonadaceae bacterium]|nr:hypothetical protein [Gemmatimonadaceae bacterium]